MKTRNIFLTLLMFPILLTANIIELSSLREIMPYVNLAQEGTIVVFDIDNTLLKSTQHLGSVAWADCIACDLEFKGISKRDAQEVVSVLWRCVQPYIKVQAVDPDTQDIIRAIQAKGIPVMCLTARMPQEMAYTQSQLEFIGIDLSPTTLTPYASQRLALIPEAFYCNGILFATPLNKKSQVFLSYLKKNHLKPKRVIFIDDKINHVKDVKEALIREGIECVGIRFTGADESVKQFDPLIAEIQWKAFPKLYSDEEARFLLMKAQNIP